MKHVVAAFAAVALLASGSMAIAKGKPESPGKSGDAPGHNKVEPPPGHQFRADGPFNGFPGASGYAPGRTKSSSGSANSKRCQNVADLEEMEERC